MTSANRILQVLLLLALAVLCKKYLQLQESYEELKRTCEMSRIENRDENTNGKPKLNSRIRSAVSILMDSSTREDNIQIGDATMERKEFTDINEPTFHNEVDRHDVTLTTPGLVISNVGGFVFQTSNVIEVKQEVKTDKTYTEDNISSHTVSTNDLTINPSESSFLQVQITQNNSQKQVSLNEGLIHHSSTQLNTIHEIRPSVSEGIYKSTDNDVKERVFDNGDALTGENVQDSDDKVTDNAATLGTENAATLGTENAAPIHDGEESISSDSTKEKKLFVLQTSLEDTIPQDLNVYNYFDTEESTPVLNTGLHGSPQHLMTDITDYAQGLDGDVCDHESCQEEEFYDEYYDDDYESSKLSASNNDKDLSRVWGTSLHDFIETPNQDELHQFAESGTTAHCHGEVETNCQFQNLCFNTKEGDFVFFKGKMSVLQNDKSNKTEADSSSFDINLSTIHRHNAAMFSVVTLPVSLMDKFSIGLVNKRSVAINRFKPDNIMHVLHDDILPLFETLTNFNYPLFGNAFDAAIVFTDHYDKGNFIDLYSSLSSVDPVSLWQHNKTYDLLCFPDIRVGLETSTVWYQYGFFQPQGPVSNWKNTNINKILTAAEYLSPHFQSECFLCSQGNYLVFLSRKDNRLILNEGELIMSVTKSTRLKVMSVSLETHSLSAIITTIRLSRGVIGMHGSLLSLAIFLPPGSIIMELFPYGVTPSHYTPFKTFCDLPGSNLVYKSWANPSRTDSVPHPDRPANSGGIRHLAEKVQSEIVSQSNVPQHLCCDDSSWLYHIYQDTIVDINGVVKHVVDAIRESESLRVKNNNLPSSSSGKRFTQDIPGSVKNLRCDKVDLSVDGSSQMSFVVSWDIPWVFHYDITASRKYKYEVVIQEGSDKDNVRIVELASQDVSYTFEPMTTDVSHSVWVRLMGDSGSRGLAKFVRCR